MGISGKIVCSGLIMLIVLCCQLLNVPDAGQTIHHHVSAELTGTMG